MFKDTEMQRFFNDLIANGTDAKTAIAKTLATFHQKVIVKYEFKQL